MLLPPMPLQLLLPSGPQAAPEPGPAAVSARACAEDDAASSGDTRGAEGWLELASMARPRACLLAAHRLIRAGFLGWASFEPLTAPSGADCAALSAPRLCALWTGHCPPPEFGSSVAAEAVAAPLAGTPAATSGVASSRVALAGAVLAWAARLEEEAEVGSTARRVARSFAFRAVKEGLEEGDFACPASGRGGCTRGEQLAARRLLAGCWAASGMGGCSVFAISGTS